MMHRPAILLLTEALGSPIRVHAQWQYPQECCGLLVGKPCDVATGMIVVEHIVPAVNAAPAPQQRSAFAIASDFLLQEEKHAAANGRDIVGIYHSHPDHPAVPSATDLAQAWPGYVYVIVSVSSGHRTDLAAWQLDESTGTFARVLVQSEPTR